jgi:Zn-dependent peptidase ImmA (M78 family)
MRSTITQLRDMVPLRRLSTAEALTIAERQAKALLRLSGATQAPVSEEVIAALPHIQIERAATGKPAAAAQWSHGRWLILLNEAHSRGRQRWSLAHELKHVLDHPFANVLYPRGNPYGELPERVSDYFAACLLMPSRWLRQAWAAGIRNEPDLARHFAVSREAVRVRLLQVGLIEPTALCLAKEA